MDRSIGLQVVAVFDGNKSEEYEASVVKYGRKHSVLPVLLGKDDIRDKYEDGVMVVEGYFDKNLHLKNGN